MRTRPTLLVVMVLMLVMLTGPAWAQDPPRRVTTGEMRSPALGALGIVTFGAGLGVLLRYDYGGDGPGRVTGAVLVGTGAVMTFWGLRYVTVAPDVSRHGVGATVSRRWGARRPAPRSRP